MHSRHGDIHEIGLQDNCEDCTEHAKNPTNNLDSLMLQQLISRNWLYRYSKDEASNRMGAPRSDNEELAMTQITNIMEKMGKLFEVDRNTMRSYLLARWHIDLFLFGN